MLRSGNRRAFGRTAGTSPIFQLPLNDLGSGQVNTTPAISSAGTVATFTRATTATCWSNAGLLLTVGSGVARSTYTELTGAAYLGFLSEEARTNSCIQNRDFTNAAWTATTMTTAKDQVGIDGIANSASSLLATAGNATVAQSITIAAVNRPFSVYVKRLTGTGNIDLAQDGATFTTQTVANDGAYHRVTLVASQLNPTLTIRLATNGDKVAVDFAMLEDSGGSARTTALSPIATTTVAVTRNADQLTFPSASNFSTSAGTVFVRAVVSDPLGGNPNRLFASNNTNAAPLLVQAAQPRVFDGTTNASSGLGNLAAGVSAKIASTWGGANMQAFKDGVAGNLQAFDGTMEAAATLRLCHDTLATDAFSGAVQDFRIWNRALAAGEISSL